jgi:hypothetical protein
VFDLVERDVRRILIVWADPPSAAITVGLPNDTLVPLIFETGYARLEIRPTIFEDARRKPLE